MKRAGHVLVASRIYPIIIGKKKMATDNPYVSPKIDLKKGERPSTQPSIMLWAIGIVFGSSFAEFRSMA